MLPLHILTRCTRPQNLLQIRDSVLLRCEFELHWHILFDTSCVSQPDVPLLCQLSHSPIHLRFFQGAKGDLGVSYLNQVLGEIDSGYVYVLDDDTLLHENFYHRVYHEIVRHRKQILVFDQWVGGRDFSGLMTRQAVPENMRVQGVDFGQIVFDVTVSRGRPLRNFEYKNDGYFIQQLWEDLAQEFLFVQETLCYYNRLVE